MFITLCKQCSLEKHLLWNLWCFSFFSTHDPPPPLEDYSKGQSKNEQAAGRKPIDLMWFMGYCTNWSVACQDLLVFIQVEIADHNRILSSEKITLIISSRKIVFSWSCFSNEVIFTVLCIQNVTEFLYFLSQLQLEHWSCSVWLWWYLFFLLLIPNREI